MAGNRITDNSAITSGLVWALLRYQDGSEFCFQTTLNAQLLNSYGVVLEEGCLVRLDKKYFENGAMVYRQFPFSGTSITLWDALTYTNEESAALREFM